MKKIFELLGQKQVKGDVGIEIEVEGRGLPNIYDATWIAKEDGSLRGENREYIFVEPKKQVEVKPALEQLAQFIVDTKAKLEFSFRTSVHVHINVQRLTYPQYLNFLYTYMLLEEPLMTYCGKERKGNRFCLRIQDAEGILDIFNYLFDGNERALDYLRGDGIRYAAINANATPKFGSLEFRAMRGNLDVEVLTTWVDALLAIRTFAEAQNDPRAILDMFVKDSPKEFIKRVLGPLTPSFTYPRLEKDMQKNFSLSLELPMRYNPPVAKKEIDVEYNANPFDARAMILQALDAERGIRAVPAPAPRWGDQAAQPILRPVKKARIQPGQFMIMDDIQQAPARVQHDEEF